MNKIFDTHAHYTSHRFDGHRDAMLQSLPAGNVGAVVECAVDYTSAKAALALAAQYPWLYAAAGIHPESLIEDDASTMQVYGGNWAAELAELENLYANPKLVAVGEIGLDYHWPIPKDLQAQLFVAQLQSAHAHDLPVLLHDREAHADMYAMMKKYTPKGVLHCYSGSADDALWLTQQGLYLGVGGTVTFKNARHIVDTVKAVPLEKLLLETDCPYMAPEPFRGKECNSTMILYTAQRIAEIKDTTLDEVLAATWHNACELFGLHV